MNRTPPRPLRVASSQPELFRTPILDTSESDSNINMRKRKYPENPYDDITTSMQQMFTNVQQMLKDLKSSQDEQFEEIKQNINALKRQNEDLLTSNAEIRQSLTEITKEQSELKARVEKLEKKDGNSGNDVCVLEQQVENLERKLRETCVEINNLQTENNTEMLTAIEQIHKTLDVDYDSRDLRSAYRLPSKSNRPRQIIIEYASLQKKIELLQAYKKYNLNNKGERLNSSSIGIAGDKKIIYMNELLTKKGKHLHYMARELVKNTEWKFCWSTRGKIFIRKEEGQAAIEVKSDDQIVSLYKDMDKSKEED